MKSYNFACNGKHVGVSNTVRCAERALAVRNGAGMVNICVDFF